METYIDLASAPRATTSADKALDHLEGVAISDGQALQTTTAHTADQVKEHLYPLPSQALDTLRIVEEQLTPATRKFWRTISTYMRENPKKTIGIGVAAVLLGMWWARPREN